MLVGFCDDFDFLIFAESIFFFGFYCLLLKNNGTNLFFLSFWIYVFFAKRSSYRSSLRDEIKLEMQYKRNNNNLFPSVQVQNKYSYLQEIIMKEIPFQPNHNISWFLYYVCDFMRIFIHYRSCLMSSKWVKPKVTCLDQRCPVGFLYCSRLMLQGRLNSRL